VLHGSLKKSAILDFNSYSGGNFSIEDNIVSWLQYPADKLFSRGLYQHVQKSTTPLDYHFISPQVVAHILNLLNYQGESSNHILLYGSPGSGKSSFARGLAEQLDCPAFEILRGDDDDEDNKSSTRQTAIRACINLNVNNRPLIIVDEADNILNTQSAWTSRGETQDKGWLNDLLDEPNLKFIWITNSIDGIETSVMRRFAYSIHFKPFNRKQRVQLWENVLQRYDSSNLIENKELEELARRYDVSAGAIDLAVKKAVEVVIKPVVESISSIEGEQIASSKTAALEVIALPKQNFISSIKMTLDAHQTLLNHGDSIKDKDNIDDSYSLHGLNIEGDFNQVMVKIKKFDEYLKSGRKGSVNNLNILFYGQSGTGKSELAKYIANTLDRSIVYKSISDIQSKWVGDTEKNIRSAFEEAEQEEAVLVFDEADSMLFNREKAQRSWEISFTNEFLNQMERFRGILICTTNLLSEMDSASMRRFSHKIGLKYLNSDGNVIFYNRMIAPLIADKLDSKNESILKRQITLAAGDFKVVRNNFAFYSPEELTHNECVQALVNEASHKKRYVDGEKIGFLKK
ncbi:MAG: ATP-binding protein, partial [Desulfamplus sp.]|nr:ATP-binding protein [Desulfamplus sp.]